MWIAQLYAYRPMMVQGHEKNNKGVADCVTYIPLIIYLVFLFLFLLVSFICADL